MGLEDVVGHDVSDDPEPARVGGRDELVELLLAPEDGVDLARGGGPVAVVGLVEVAVASHEPPGGIPIHR